MRSLGSLWSDKTGLLSFVNWVIVSSSFLACLFCSLYSSDFITSPLFSQHSPPLLHLQQNSANDDNSSGGGGQHQQQKQQALPQTPKRYFLAVVTIVRHEEEYLEEWLSFHQLVGVDHVYLYDNYNQNYGTNNNIKTSSNNSSSDNSSSSNSHSSTGDFPLRPSLLTTSTNSNATTSNITTSATAILVAPYVTAGFVTYVPWSFAPNQAGRDKRYLSHQNKAYHHCIRYFARDVQWIAQLDVDEFLFPASPHINSVADVLRALQSDGVGDDGEMAEEGDDLGQKNGTDDGKGEEEKKEEEEEEEEEDVLPLLTTTKRSKGGGAGGSSGLAGVEVMREEFGNSFLNNYNGYVGTTAMKTPPATTAPVHNATTKNNFHSTTTANATTTSAHQISFAERSVISRFVYKATSNNWHDCKSIGNLDFFAPSSFSSFSSPSSSFSSSSSSSSPSSSYISALFSPFSSLFSALASSVQVQDRVHYWRYTADSKYPLIISQFDSKARGRIMTSSPSSASSVIVHGSGLRINHYYTKSTAEFERKMQEQGDNWMKGKKDWQNFQSRNKNEVKDEAILRFVPQLRASLKGKWGSG